MPRLTCPGGHEIDLSSIPNPNGYVLIGEQTIEDVVDRLTAACEGSAEGVPFARQAFAALSSRNPGIMQIYKCPVCGRLAVFERGSDDVPLAWYQREPADAGAEAGKP